jgi:hypothetical protein
MLRGNKIGDAGAASIGGALAYVPLSLFELIFIHKDISLAPPDVFGLILGYYQDAFVFIGLQCQFDVDHT